MGSDPVYPVYPAASTAALANAAAASVIALDWGTTSLRAYLLTRDGRVQGERAGGEGIMQIEGGTFAAALNALCSDWLTSYPDATLIASGMIGSKQGWIEAPYCPCPANAAALARNMVTINVAGSDSDGDDGHKPRPLHIVPGVSFIDPASGVPDVMRGEETQIIGAIPTTGAHLVVLPGTHSKWAWVEDGAIVRFSSWMTGEVYAALTQHTILGRLMQLDAAHDADAFARGVRYGHSKPALLLNQIFSARTLGLFNEIDSAALPSYLSGMLIGTEIGAAISSAAHSQSDAPAQLLGSAALVQRYQTAFELAGLKASIGSADCAARGLYQLAQVAE